MGRDIAHTFSAFMRSLDHRSRFRQHFALRHLVGGPSGVIALIAAMGLTGCHNRAPQLAASQPVCTLSNATAAPDAAGSTSGGTRQLSNGAATFDSAWTIIARSHWDTTYNGVKWTAVRDSLRPKAAAAKDIHELRSVLTQMLATLGQSHFSILPGESNPESAGTPSRDQSGNIGATIRDVDGTMLVTAVRSGGPAERAGLRPGFAIQAVDGCAIAARPALPDARRAKLTHWSATMTQLRGPVGDSARVRVRDADGVVRTVAVNREIEPGIPTKIGNLPSITAKLDTTTRVMGGRTIGVIRFNIWMPTLSEALGDAVNSFRGADAIVIDIRGNFGGIAMMAPGVAGHFVDTSLTLGTMILRGAVQNYVINPQRVNSANKRVTPFAGPVAIVVDELSISTSEIFAAGMQAFGRARIFGAQSAGQALPSVAEQLPNGDILYHAIANFLSPTGKPVEGAGVVPDVAVPVTRAALLKGRDPAFDAAMSWAATSKKAGPGLPQVSPATSGGRI